MPGRHCLNVKVRHVSQQIFLFQHSGGFTKFTLIRNLLCGLLKGLLMVLRTTSVQQSVSFYDRYVEEIKPQSRSMANHLCHREQTRE